MLKYRKIFIIDLSPNYFWDKSNKRMQLPVRKPGKYTHLKPDQHLTRAKFNELKNKLEWLKFNRPRAAEEVKRLAAMGDFSENAAYQIAKGRLRGMNQKILELEDHLKRAVIIKPDKNSGLIQLGSQVTVINAGREKTYLILGSSETDPKRGIISSHSPIGSALLGKKIGDQLKIKLADRKVEYKIIRIE